MASDLAVPHLRDAIRRQPLFEALDPGVVEALVAASGVSQFDDGEILMHEGADPDAIYVLLEGAVEVVRASGGDEVIVALLQAGEVVGEMSVLSGLKRSATVRARGPVTALAIPAETFQALLLAHPQATFAILRASMVRLQGAEGILVQHQKMAGLGVLAAGLAHELNNPASALARGASRIGDLATEWERQALRLGGIGLEPGETDALDALRSEMAARAGAATLLDPLERDEREQAIQRWLEMLGIERSWQVAPALVGVGWDVAGLRQIEEFIAATRLGPVLTWLAAGQSVHALVHELVVSARTISELVTAVKSYARLDRAPVGEVDVHEGIEQSLTILRHKLRGVRLVREYGGDIPLVAANGGELNQVWTNLIDNAADALAGSGTLAIRTAYEDDAVVVEIHDTGPGIPDSALGRLFEPFFTTKPPGQGTGLGLSISYSIVRRHGGRLTARSGDGTTMTVRIPAGTVAGRG